MLEASGSGEAAKPKTSSMWKRQAGCSGLRAGPTKSCGVGLGGNGRFCNSECTDRMPVPRAALVMIIGTMDVRFPERAIFSTRFRIGSLLPGHRQNIQTEEIS